MDDGSANSVLRTVHDGYIALAVSQGVVLLVMLLARAPSGLGYVVGGLGMAGVVTGYVYAGRRIGSDSNLDARHAAWARSIRAYGLCICLASAVLVAVDYLDAAGA